MEADGEQEGEREHDRRVAQREEEADAQGAPAVGHQLSRRVVNRRDVVGVERVAQAQRVRRDPQADAECSRLAEHVVVWRDQYEQDEEAEDVQADDHCGHPGDPLPFVAGEPRT